MKPSAFLINCARGPVVTPNLGGALDAKDRRVRARHDRSEPLPDPHPLEGARNVIVAPHAA